MQHQGTVNLVTLGCSKNQVDSEVIAARLQRAGFQVVHEATTPTDLVIVNTCGFILDAKEQSIETILMHLERKAAGDVRKVYAIGCLAERYKADLLETMPDLDGVFGFNDLPKLLNDATFDLLCHSERLISTPKHYAYLKVSEGCDRQCAFCAIPVIRGKHVSKPKDLILREAEMLAEKGVKEIMLIAQDLTYYGMDLLKRRDLESLLRALAQVNGIEWIRLHYAYPANFPYDILDVIADYSTICKYLDMPLQHISDEVLKSMLRGNTSTQTYKLIETIRNKVPGIALRTTLVSGFPTETRAHHKELVQFVQEMRFERLGVFAYSQEENTPAYALGDPIKLSEKNRRVEEIMALQEEISLKNNESKVNTVMKVIIDSEEENYYVGRTEFDSPDVDNDVLIDKSVPLQIGEFYPILIQQATTFSLLGKKV